MASRLDRWAVAIILAAMTIAPRQSTATIAEQRARLPPPAECEDPIEGTWRGLTWYPNHRQWYEFTLDIERVAGSDRDLSGVIVAHFWDGVPERSEAGACQGGQRVKIRQPALGSFDGERVQFNGTSWEVQEVVCGDYHGGYALENFTGVLDRKLQEFQSVNDWSDAVNDEPTVFRRIQCLSERPKQDQPSAPPPPFYPDASEKPRKRSGC